VTYGTRRGFSMIGVALASRPWVRLLPLSQMVHIFWVLVCSIDVADSGLSLPAIHFVLFCMCSWGAGLLCSLVKSCYCMFSSLHHDLYALFGRFHSCLRCGARVQGYVVS
jgi:hypothetical protein